MEFNEKKPQIQNGIKLGSNKKSNIEICINGNVFRDDLLEYSNSNILSGWKIVWDTVVGKMKFIQVKSAGGNGSDMHLNYNQYTPQSINPADLIDFFPSYNGAPIEMYFLNYSEFYLANENYNISNFCLSLFYIETDNQNGKNPDSIPILRIETEVTNNTTSVPTALPATPSVLLAPPCPPIWKPGYNWMKKVPVIGSTQL